MRSPGISEEASALVKLPRKLPVSSKCYSIAKEITDNAVHVESAATMGV